MGGKSGTTTQSVSIPPDVLKRYNAVNARAESVAATPFQPYTGQFVAGITPTQQAGINATTQYAQSAQPYYQAATGQLGQAQGQGQQAIQQAFGSLGQGVDVGQQYAQAATQGVGAALQAGQPYQGAATQAAFAGSQAIAPENLNIQGYMNPYTQSVADTTYQALRQQQQQEMAGQTANAIRSGAFGGDRAGLVAANLARQQQLGTAQAMAPIYQQGYGQALSTATGMAQANRAALQNLSSQLQGIGQQGFGQQMGAAQQMAALGQQQFGQGLGAAGQLGALGQQQYGMGAGTAQQLAALGSGAQQSALQGAQAQLGAGTLEQQTQQADLTARYQQFLQERGYDFQVAQFLANIAMGTGALSGQTTTTTQPMPFFSDRRVKDDVKEIGKTHDGLPIYSYKYKGDDQTQIGLMAQDVEKKHPDAVYDMGGVKGVDYKQATEHAERPERYSGGLVPASQGGSVYEPGAYARGGYAPGGLVDPNDLQALIAQQQESFGPFGEGGIYGGSQHQAPFSGVKGVVPQTRMHVPKLMRPDTPPPMPEGLGAQALGAYDQAMAMKKRYDEAKSLFEGEKTPQKKTDEARPSLTTREEVKNLAGPDIKAPKSVEEEKGLLSRLGDLFFAEGGVVPREGFAIGGSKDSSLPYEEEDKTPYKYFPTEILETEKAELQKPGQPPAQTSQTGVGLGTLLGLFLKDGGVVPRRGYQTAGTVVEEEPIFGQTIEGVKPDEKLPPLPMVRNVKKQDVFEEKPTPDANFARSYSRTLQFEGPKAGIDNDGKLRRYGITPQQVGVSSVEEITPSTAAPAYYKQYWLASGADKLDPKLAQVHFDTAVNSGVGRAEKLLEASGGDPSKYLDLREQFLRNLAENDTPKNGVYKYRPYLTGWMNRIAQLRSDISGDAGSYRDLRPDAPEGGVVPKGGATSQQTASTESSGLLPSANKFLAENQGWLVPFGAGVRGMVQSKSPFFGGALLEGIGTGMEAVGASQKQLADIGQTVALTEGIRAGIPAKAINADGSFNVIDEEGRVFAIDPNEYYIRRMRGEKITPYLGKEGFPVQPKGLEKVAEETIERAEKAVQGEPTQGEKPVTTPQGRVAGGDPMALNDEEQGEIRKELITLFSKYPKERLESLKDDRTNLRKYINESANAAEKQRLNITYADLLQSRGQKGIFVGGKFAEPLSGLAATLDQFSKAAGGQGFAPDQNATVEDAIKLYSQLVQQARAKEDSKTLGELEQVGRTYPFITASGPGAAKTMAEIIVQSQEPIYKAQLATNMMDAAGSFGGVDLRGEYVGGTFENTFRNKFNRIATEDKKAIEKLLNTRSGLFEKDEQGQDDPNRPISLFSRMARLSRIRQSEATKLAKDFLNGDMRIFNYFPNLQIVPD
jgi:hypothetical protein